MVSEFATRILLLKGIAYAIHRAAVFYKNSNEFETNRKKIMKIDHSWDASAEQYLNLYKSLKE